MDNLYFQRRILKILTLLFLSSFLLQAQEARSDDKIAKQIDKKFEALDHRLDELAKALDDLLWYTTK